MLYTDIVSYALRGQGRAAESIARHPSPLTQSRSTLRSSRATWSTSHASQVSASRTGC